MHEIKFCRTELQLAQELCEQNITTIIFRKLYHHADPATIPTQATGNAVLGLQHKGKHHKWNPTMMAQLR
jgi:hypothetical protein